jgi:TrmH family RNA methyltransferase
MKNPEVAELTTTLLSRDIQCDMLSDTLFESFSSIHASVGIILLFHTTQPEIADITLTSSCIVLEDVQDPGNLGTILRTATAAGIKSAILSPQCASAWSPKALRAGMGAQFGITIYEDVDVLQFVTDSPLPTLVTTLSSRSTPLYETDLKKPVAWILGNEGQGVSEALTNAATTHISIPQADTPVESLNVAAAAAICLYEQYRQLHATD